MMGMREGIIGNSDRGDGMYRSASFRRHKCSRTTDPGVSLTLNPRLLIRSLRLASRPVGRHPGETERWWGGGGCKKIAMGVGPSLFFLGVGKLGDDYFTSCFATLSPRTTM